MHDVGQELEGKPALGILSRVGAGSRQRRME
jgi:hypothetical protein